MSVKSVDKMKWKDMEDDKKDLEAKNRPSKATIKTEAGEENSSNSRITLIWRIFSYVGPQNQRIPKTNPVKF